MGLINFIWFLTFGWLTALIYLLLSAVFALTIIGIPIAKALLQFAKLNAFPFDKEIIKETELKGSKNVSGIRKFFGTLVNLIWLPIGLALAVVYVILGVVNCLTIKGIPQGIVFCRTAKFVIWPIGAKVVSKKQAYAAAAANEIAKRR